MRKNQAYIFYILFLVLLVVLPACSIGIRQELTPPPGASSTTTIADARETSPADSGSGDQPGQSFEIDPTPPETEIVGDSGNTAENQQAAILNAFPPAPQTNGQILLVYGQVVDTNGNPIPGASVEFWQTDANGIYDHPGDPDTERRDQDFQFYGSSEVNEEGAYRFRTIVPGEYEPRPAHIHVKVRLSGAEVLTTQFYFVEDAESVQNESIFRSAGETGENLYLITQAQMDVYETEVLVARKDIVIDTGSGGDLATTPAQAEGPYYPRVNVSEYDNDLVLID